MNDLISPTMSRSALLLLAAFTGTALSAQLVLDNTLTPDQLVQDVLLGGGVTATNVTFNGLPGTQTNVQIAGFDGSQTTLGLDNGMLLSTGGVDSAPGPNDQAGATSILGTFPGDPDLELASGQQTFDAAVLEFDFIPDGDSLSFRFVFGSEEYMEFVGLGVNDVFGFFLSGPGISGPYSNNAANIALIPGTSTPVSIDALNASSFGQFYVDNGDGSEAPFNADPQYIQYDGFTVALTARALVECGATYHIKIAIADGGDDVWDSGVFMEAGSFSSPNVVALNIANASVEGGLVEGCLIADLLVTRPDTVGDLDVELILGGTATNGVDHTQIPQLVTIPAGSSSVSLPLEAFEDGLAEGTETLILSAITINSCGDTVTSSVTIPIEDHTPIDVLTEDLELQCDQDTVPITALAGGGYGELSFAWNTGGQLPTILVPGLADGDYTVTVSDECGWSVTSSVSVSSGCGVVIPNVFTPNGDGQNDRLEIGGLAGKRNTLRIFNRWGEVVYEIQNYRNQWDGRDVPDGTYYYELLVDGEKDPFTGHLTILSSGRR